MASPTFGGQLSIVHVPFRPPRAPKPESHILGRRIPVPELCRADFVAWTGSASRRWETCARTQLHSIVTRSYCTIGYGKVNRNLPDLEATKCRCRNAPVERTCFVAPRFSPRCQGKPADLIIQVRATAAGCGTESIDDQPLFVAQRYHRVDLGGPAGGEPRG